MKLLKKAWLGLALSAGVLASGAASATAVCQGCNYLFASSATNIGILNPLTFDSASFTHTGLGNGSFNDWWVFTVSPAGLGGINAVFLPTSAVTGFNITLWSMAANTCAPVVNPGMPTSTPGACGAANIAGGNLTAVPGAVNNGGGAFVVNLPNVPLFGSYAFNITGMSIAAGTTQPNLYSGNVSTTVIPEPGSLALAALGLLAAGATLRRRAQA